MPHSPISPPPSIPSPPLPLSLPFPPPAIERECLVVRDYYWWPSVRRLYESRTLQWAGPTLPGELQEVLQSLLNPSLFHSNQ